MISVVIPAYNEEKLLARCLDSLVHQNIQQPFEVILVDNDSTDTTREIAQKYTQKLFLCIFIEKTKGRGAARKLGFSKATGDIILSTDADTIVPVDWITQLTSVFTDTTIVAVTGTCRIIECAYFTNVFFNTCYQTSTELLYRLIEGHWCLIGPNFAVRRDLYVKTAGFDASLNCREDADLSAKIALLGKIKRIPLAVTFSGRRYTRGVLAGAMPYVRNRLQERFIGKKNIFLEDIR